MPNPSKKLGKTKWLISLVMVFLVSQFIFGVFSLQDLVKSQPKEVVFKVFLAQEVSAAPVGTAGTAATGITAPAATAEKGYIARATDSVIAEIITYLCLAFIKFIGGLLAILIKVLLWLMKYNGFVVSKAVVNGWVLVRDISNLFFVVILLAIAIGTILRVESYNFKKLLPKVLIMAVLVNFSRTICGLIIDAAQVVMMTFVAAFAGVYGEMSLIGLLQLDKIVNAATWTPNETEALNEMTVAVSALLAVVLLLVALVTITVYVAVLMMRIVYLWVLVIFSPLAYIAAAFPQGMGYAKQWWQEFGKYVIIGPLIAFNLWLAFSIAGSNTGQIDPIEVGVNADEGKELITAGLGGTKQTTSLTGGGQDQKHFINEIGGPYQLISFIIAIAMLLAGLAMINKVGVAGGSMASNAMSRMRQLGTAPFRGGLRLGMKAAKSPITAAAWGTRKLKAGEVPGLGWMRGIDLNPASVYRTVSDSLKRKKEEDIRRGRRYAGEHLKSGGFRGAILGLGATDYGDNYFKGFMFQQGIRRALYGKAGRAKKFETEAKREEVIAGKFTAKEKSEAEQKEQDVQARAQAIRAQLASGKVDLNDQENESSKLLDQFMSNLEESVADTRKEAGEARDSGKADDADKLEQEADKLAVQLANLQDIKEKNNGKIEFSHLSPPTKVAVESLLKEKAGKYDDAAKSIRKEIDDRTIEGKTVTETEKAQARAKAKSWRKRAERAATLTPLDAYTRGERRSAFEEQRKLFGETTNEFELMSAFKSAVNRGEVTEAGGIALQAARVGHLNELVNDNKASKNYYFDEDGRITDDESKKDITRGRNGLMYGKGEDFDANVNGLHALIQEIFMHRLNAGRQTALSLENDLSNISEGVNWWTFGQAITADSDGILQQNSKEVQQQRNFIEMSKKDFERLSREGNRGADMTERWVDPNDHSKGRTATLDPVGVLGIAQNWESILVNLPRGRYNKNKAMHLMSEDNHKILDMIGEIYIPDNKKNRWKSFRYELERFAGKAAREAGGTMTSRVYEELGEAEAIRRTAAGTQPEGFFNVGLPGRGGEAPEGSSRLAPIPKVPSGSSLSRDATEKINDLFTQVGDLEKIPKRAAGGPLSSDDQTALIDGFNKLTKAIDDLSNGLSGQTGFNEISRSFSEFGKNIEKRKNDNEVMRDPNAVSNLLREIRLAIDNLKKSEEEQEDEEK